MAINSSKVYVEVLCPVCGRAMGKIIVAKRASGREGMEIKKEMWQLKSKTGEEIEVKESYLDYLEKRWDIDKEEWGFIRDCSGGRGSGFPIVGWLKKKEDAPDLFEKLKQQLLRGIAWWVNRGWITEEEILETIKGVKRWHPP